MWPAAIWVSVISPCLTLPRCLTALSAWHFQSCFLSFHLQSSLVWLKWNPVNFPGVHSNSDYDKRLRQSVTSSSYLLPEAEEPAGLSALHHLQAWHCSTPHPPFFWLSIFLLLPLSREELNQPGMMYLADCSVTQYRTLPMFSHTNTVSGQEDSEESMWAMEMAKLWGVNRLEGPSQNRSLFPSKMPSSFFYLTSLQFAKHLWFVRLSNTHITKTPAKAYSISNILAAILKGLQDLSIRKALYVTSSVSYTTS